MRFTLILVLISANSLLCQLVINELCASNTELFLDDDDKRRDWIEIYNPTNYPLFTDGYFLSDDLNNLEKYAIPHTLVDSEDYLLILASGEDKIDDFIHANFKLKKGGETLMLSRNNQVVSYLNYEKLESNHSLGRYPDGSNNVVFFDLPSPKNQNSSINFLGYSDIPEVHQNSGYYSKVHLKFYPKQSTKVYYSLNQDLDLENYQEYLSPIEINNSVVVSFYAVEPGRLPSKISYRTYLNEGLSNFPTVMINVENDLLFDEEIGLFTMGSNAQEDFPYYGANFWSNEELEINVAYIRSNNTQAFQDNAGLRIHGGSMSRTRPMKSLRILARDKYGEASFQEKLFNHKDVDQFERFVLRNSGSDFNKTHFRDGILHQIILEDNLQVDASGFQRTRVYINGQFWGIYNLREKIDKYYIKGNHNIKLSDLDLLEENNMVVEGDTLAFSEFCNIIENSNLENIEDWNYFESQMDVKNMADYFICETYLTNDDWPHNNLKYWKPKSAGKWRYILFDLDASLNGVPWYGPELDLLSKIHEPFYDSIPHIMLFKAATGNVEFKRYFINRYADLMNTTFSVKRMMEAQSSLINSYNSNMSDHFAKWGGSFYSWAEHCSLSMMWMSDRPAFSKKYIQEFYGLNGQIQVKVEVSPEGAGKVQLNTLTLDEFPFNGTYFDGNSVDLTAIESSSYKFHHWEFGDSEKYNFRLSVNKNFTNDVQIRAVFKPLNEMFKLSVVPSIISDSKSVQINFEIQEEEALCFSLIDPLGNVITLKQMKVTSAGNNSINMDIPELASGFYYILMESDHQRKTSKILIK